MTLDEAKERTGYSIPVLDEQQVPDPCGHGDVSLRLHEVWASVPDTEAEFRQVGLTYGSGVWMSVTPKIFFATRISASSDLPSVDSAFSAEDRPEGLETGEVRGHTAWVDEMDSDFSCDDTSGNTQPSPEPSVGHSDDGGGDEIYYDAARIGHISWMENDLVIHLTGPLPVSQLASLAEQLTWTKR